MKKNIICFLLLFVNYFLFSNVTTNLPVFKDEYAIKNRPQIPNGEYSVNKIITTFPCETPTEKDLNWFIKVQDEKFFLYYRDKTKLGESFSFQTNLEFTEYDNTSENSDKYYKFYLTSSTQKKLPQKGYVIYLGGGGASGTSIDRYLIYDGEKLYFVFDKYYFAYNYDYILIFGTENKEPEITYDITFPLYVFNDNGKINAYTTKDFTNPPDFLIPINNCAVSRQKVKDIITDYEFESIYYYISDENIENLIILNDMFITDSGVFFEGTYHDKTVWIKEEDFPQKNIFLSIDHVYSYGGYNNGL